MINSLEMHVIYCITIIGMVMYRLCFMLRFASITKAHWRGCMLDQFHQHGHSKRTFPTARAARVSIFGLINIRDTFIAKFHKLKVVYKGIFSNLSF
jgi:hypothetical protein